MSSESVHVHPTTPFGYAPMPSAAHQSAHTPAQSSARLSSRVAPHSSEHPALRPSATVTGALRAVESFLLRGGQQTARRNAWAAVVEDRQRARERREAQHEMDALVSGVRASALRD